MELSAYLTIVRHEPRKFPTRRARPGPWVELESSRNNLAVSLKGSSLATCMFLTFFTFLELSFFPFARKQVFLTNLLSICHFAVSFPALPFFFRSAEPFYLLRSSLCCQHCLIIRLSTRFLRAAASSSLALFSSLLF